jgi:hypothetical protein
MLLRIQNRCPGRIYGAFRKERKPLLSPRFFKVLGTKDTKKVNVTPSLLLSYSKSPGKQFTLTILVESWTVRSRVRGYHDAWPVLVSARKSGHRTEENHFLSRG